MAPNIHFSTVDGKDSRKKMRGKEKCDAISTKSRDNIIQAWNWREKLNQDDIS